MQLLSNLVSQNEVKEEEEIDGLQQPWLSSQKDQEKRPHHHQHPISAHHQEEPTVLVHGVLSASKRLLHTVTAWQIHLRRAGLTALSCIKINMSRSKI